MAHIQGFLFSFFQKYLKGGNQHCHLVAYGESLKRTIRIKRGHITLIAKARDQEIVRTLETHLKALSCMKNVSSQNRVEH